MVKDFQNQDIIILLLLLFFQYMSSIANKQQNKVFTLNRCQMLDWHKIFLGHFLNLKDLSYDVERHIIQQS